MAVSFKDLKTNRKSDFEKLQKQIDEQTSNGGGGQDKRFWTPTVDKAGNGFAIIRFLSAPAGEDVAFVRIFNHAFKGPTGKWYIENSRTTLGEKDPVGEMNSRLWNETEDDASPQRKQARLQKRKLGYISNILVINDPANPDNNGKVFLYRYGKKIWDKINDAMYPSEEEQKLEGKVPFNPYDMWEGANFKLKIRQVEGYRNYDKSEFDKPEPISNDDDKLEAIWKQEYSLQEFIAPDKFKSYEELEKLLNQVLGGTTKPAAKTAEAREEYAPRQPRSRAAAEAPAADVDDVLSGQTTSGSSDDDELAFFENLGKD
jgi:hypothetical protein